MCAASAAKADPIACDTPLIVVVAASPDLAARVCRVAAEADAMLSALGLRHSRPVTIEVTPDLGVSAAGCVAYFHTGGAVLTILPPDCLEGEDGRLGPFPKLAAGPLFESLVIHELAHAYVEDSAAPDSLPRLVHEYIAYAAQLDYLSKPDRDGILRRSKADLPVDLAGFSEALLNFAPDRFAATAWLHLRAQPKPADMVQALLDGTARFEIWDE
ncbi:MAG: hypothetical protein KJN93_07760 [Alphaproteobacteria bacterium]|nr:hypothetical protein [Alphaproteobacteria bacterium]